MSAQEGTYSYWQRKRAAAYLRQWETAAAYQVLTEEAAEDYPELRERQVAFFCNSIAAAWAMLNGAK